MRTRAVVAAGLVLAGLGWLVVSTTPIRAPFMPSGSDRSLPSPADSGCKGRKSSLTLEVERGTDVNDFWARATVSFGPAPLAVRAKLLNTYPPPTFRFWLSGDDGRPPVLVVSETAWRTSTAELDLGGAVLLMEPVRQAARTATTLTAEYTGFSGSRTCPSRAEVAFDPVTRAVRPDVKLNINDQRTLIARMQSTASVLERGGLRLADGSSACRRMAALFENLEAKPAWTRAQAYALSQVRLTLPQCPEIPERVGIDVQRLVGPMAYQLDH